jgi:outer membrane protein assembly factor BamB
MPQALRTDVFSPGKADDSDPHDLGPLVIRSRQTGLTNTVRDRTEFSLTAGAVISPGMPGITTLMPDVRLLAAANITEWPQVQNNPQHTGFTPQTLGSSFAVAWTHPFQPEKIYPQVQAIVYDGKVFVGTEMGNLYALDALTGAEAWVFPVGAPILNSVAASAGRVFFGALDGAAYALDSDDGRLLWRTELHWRLGLSTAPVLAENKVMLGGRSGVFYALDPDTGEVEWSFDAGPPILQTAAYNNGRIFFGGMDMRVYALNTADGSLAWRSEQVDGMALKDYWPVVHGGYVYVRPMGMGGLGVSNQALITDPAAQQMVLADYEANPQDYSISLHRFDEATGERTTVIHYGYQTMNGATSPPCIDRDGYLVMPAPYVVGYQTGWGRLDPDTRTMVDLLYDGTDLGYGNSDENMNLSCTGNKILALHTEEYNAHDTAAFDLDTWRWSAIAVGHTNRQMSTNTQGGGGNPASVANGYVYHISYHELIARTTSP